jgi:hypothetical protein
MAVDFVLLVNAKVDNFGRLFFCFRAWGLILMNLS